MKAKLIYENKEARHPPIKYNRLKLVNGVLYCVEGQWGNWPCEGEMELFPEETFWAEWCEDEETRKVAQLYLDMIYG